MKFSPSHWLIILVSIFAGLGDFLAGMALLIAPGWTLNFLQTPPPEQTLFIRYLGVFVGTVGLSYFLGLITTWRRGGYQPSQSAWEISALFRLAVVLFLSVAIARHLLMINWLIVVVTDFVWAALQLSLIFWGIFSRSENES